MMRALTFLVTMASLNAQAQLSHGGTPFGWGAPAGHFAPVPTTTLTPLAAPADTMAALSAGFSGEARLGQQRMVPVDVLAQGGWESVPDGGRICRYMLESPGAAMISVQFDRFRIPAGGKVFLFDAARTTFIGSFTHANEKPSGVMATAVIPGDAVIIEYQEPPGAGRAQLHVASITHTWFNMFDHTGSTGQRGLVPGWPSSAPCQTDVSCPVAADWQDQNRSVVLFMRPDGGWCNGTLLNNTANDGTPYLLMAHHCYQPTESQWIFYFNYQNPTCGVDSGQTYQTMSGAIHRAGSYSKDFDLVELDTVPPDSFNVYYAGWDHGGTPPQSGAMISNPLADVKKIGFYDAAAVTETGGLTSTQCWRNLWVSGILESIASGAPQFDQNKRVVGHLIDGDQTCETATTAPTWASKFSENWDGASPSTRLRDWLDPADTAMYLDGYDPNAAAATAVQVRLKAFLQGPYVPGTGMMNATLNDSGLVPLVEPYTGMGYSFIGGGGGASTSQAVLDVTGPDEVVDWVVVELRDKNDPSSVLASRPALLRRNGTVVDPDGISDVAFTGQPLDQYYVAVRHRNHLGIITATSHLLSGTATLMDLTDGSTALMGDSATSGIAGVQCMWSGDVNRDDVVRYTGVQNDRDPILSRIGGLDPTQTVNGYYNEDINLDGVVKYTGANNDRDAMLVNVGALPTGQRDGTIP